MKEHPSEKGSEHPFGIFRIANDGRRIGDAVARFQTRREADGFQAGEAGSTGFFITGSASRAGGLPTLWIEGFPFFVPSRREMSQRYEKGGVTNPNNHEFYSMKIVSVRSLAGEAAVA